MVISPGTNQEIFGISEAAKILSVAEKTLYLWKQQGRVPFHQARPHSAITFRRSEIEILAKYGRVKRR